MRAFWSFVILVGFSLVWLNGTQPARQQTIPDVSWPNCTLKLSKAEQGIVGITGGLALRPNPCLAKEASNYKHLSVYVNTGYPGLKKASKFQNSPKVCSSKDEKCIAYNYGYNNGLYAIKYSLLKGIVADHWWLDVETENSWSDSVKVNRASLRGNLDAIANFAGRDRAGFYSYPGQWDLITGKWDNGYPAWAATGSVQKLDAVMTCDLPAFTGGKIVLAQYTPNLDQNLICD